MKRAYIVLGIALLLPNFTKAEINLNQLPACDQVTDIITNILNERSEETGRDLRLVEISAIKEQKNDLDKSIRYCSAIIQTKSYKFDTLYSISPYQGDVWVQIEDANPIIGEKELAEQTQKLTNQLADDKLKAFELAKKHGDTQNACLSLRVAKQFYLDANNEEGYAKVMNLLKENNCK